MAAFAAIKPLILTEREMETEPVLLLVDFKEKQLMEWAINLMIFL